MENLAALEVVDGIVALALNSFNDRLNCSQAVGLKVLGVVALKLETLNGHTDIVVHVHEQTE